MPTFDERATIHSALSDPLRLGILDELAISDRSPSELVEAFEVKSNLLAHHLGVLADAGLIGRIRSEGDRRRHYLRLSNAGRLQALNAIKPLPALFVCTHNSARSQLAAALWERETGAPAASAGTQPAERVHHQAVAAGERAGIDISRCVPQHIESIDVVPPVVITVCDRAHEELRPSASWLHWSTSDPVRSRSQRVFNDVVSELQTRIRTSVEIAEGATA